MKKVLALILVSSSLFLTACMHGRGHHCHGCATECCGKKDCKKDGKEGCDLKKEPATQAAPETKK